MLKQGAGLAQPAFALGDAEQAAFLRDAPILHQRHGRRVATGINAQYAHTLLPRAADAAQHAVDKRGGTLCGILLG